MTMGTLLAILALILLLAGLAGSVIPVLPGPPLSYLGLLVMQWSGYGGFSASFLIGWAAATAVITIADYYLPVGLVRRAGGSRAAVTGSAVGLLAGIFLFPPVGMIIFPFAGALAGELLHGRSSGQKALRVAMASFAGFLLGSGFKFIACALMLFYAIKSLFI